MMLQTDLGVLAIVCLLSFHPLASALGANRQGVEDLISEIARHEEVIQNISAKITVTIPEKDTTFMVAEWGYSYGREYVEGTQYLNVSGVAENVPHSIKNAFDGDIMGLYRHDPLMKRHNGRVTSLEPENFTGFPTPNTLLGHHVNPSGRLTVAEALRQAKEVHLQPGMHDIDGHECYLVEAIETYQSSQPGFKGGDVRLWVDPTRDYRILKLERYLSAPPPMRWKNIRRRVDNIKLQQIDGVWIPVEGESHSLITEVVPKPGMSKEEIQKMEPEEAILHVDFQAVPMLPMKRIQVDAASVSFGKEIPSEKFTIQWPEGTTVWDDFTQISYKVGAQGGVSLKDSPHGELAEVSPPDGMSGSNSTDVNDIARADANSVDGKQGGVSEQDTADSSDRSLAHRGIPSVLKLAFALLCFIGLACFARRYYRARNV